MIECAIQIFCNQIASNNPAPCQTAAFSQVSEWEAGCFVLTDASGRPQLTAPKQVQFRLIVLSICRLARNCACTDQNSSQSVFSCRLVSGAFHHYSQCFPMAASRIPGYAPRGYSDAHTSSNEPPETDWFPTNRSESADYRPLTALSLYFAWWTSGNLCSRLVVGTHRGFFSNGNILKTFRSKQEPLLGLFDATERYHLTS